MGDTIYVDVKLNGKGPFSAILDSGGSGATLSPEIAEQIGVMVTGHTSGSGEGDGAESGGTASLQSVGIGAATYAPEPFYCFPNDPVALSLGYDVFSRYVVTVDYARHLLALTLPSRFHYRGSGTVVACRFVKGYLPVVQGTIDGIPGGLTIDTGNSLYLTLRRPFVEKHLDSRATHLVEGIIGVGAGGPIRQQITRVRTLTLGAVQVHDLVAGLSLNKQNNSPGMACNVGSSVLKQFKLICDYSHHRLILEKNANYGHPDAFNRSGLFLRRQGDGWAVLSIVPGGPGEQSGLSVGDIILSIDGEDATQLKGDDFREKMRGPVGTRMHLTTQAGPVRKNVVLVLRDLV